MFLNIFFFNLTDKVKQIQEEVCPKENNNGKFQKGFFTLLFLIGSFILFVMGQLQKDPELVTGKLFYTIVNYKILFFYSKLIINNELNFFIVFRL